MPCIIEAQKTIDYKTFYKSSDISQMMFVHDFPFELKNEKELESFNPFNCGDKFFERLVWKKDPDHKYKLKHGLAKCTRNIREKRFKAKTKYNQDEILDVAKKLKSIIDVRIYYITLNILLIIIIYSYIERRSQLRKSNEKCQW